MGQGKDSVKLGSRGSKYKGSRKPKETKGARVATSITATRV